MLNVDEYGDHDEQKEEIDENIELLKPLYFHRPRTALISVTLSEWHCLK